MALVLLLLMFGSMLAAAVPLLAAVFSVGSGVSLLGLIAAVTNLPTTAPTVATLLGLGVAIDYGLFLVARHIEQLEDGVDVVTSIGRTAATSGLGHRGRRVDRRRSRSSACTCPACPSSARSAWRRRSSSRSPCCRP